MDPSTSYSKLRINTPWPSRRLPEQGPSVDSGRFPVSPSDPVFASSLFHVVVDNDVTAQRCIVAMNAEKLGRLTFIPLNRVKSQARDYPSSREITPLIRHLRFNQEHVLALEQVSRPRWSITPGV
jgi:hypothetical protein